jgi:hypothetical protein
VLVFTAIARLDGPYRSIETSCRRFRSKFSIVGAGVMNGFAGPATPASATEVEQSNKSVEERIVTACIWR